MTRLSELPGASPAVQRLLQAADDAEGLLDAAKYDATHADEAADRNKARALVLATLKAVKDFDEAARALYDEQRSTRATSVASLIRGKP